MAITRIQRPMSYGLSDFAFRHISAGILNGEFEPGERIRDTDLARELGISRSPVREALLRLQRAGLVRIEPSRYTRVAELDRRSARRAVSYASTLLSIAVVEALSGSTPSAQQQLERAAAALGRSQSAAARAERVGELLQLASALASTPLLVEHLAEAELVARFALRSVTSGPSDSSLLRALAGDFAATLRAGDLGEIDRAVRLLFEHVIASGSASPVRRARSI